jgi:hypothetical protein
MLAKTIFAALAVATVGLTAPAIAGEGSPDISLGPYGNYGRGPSYPYVTQPDIVLTVPAYPSGPGFYGSYDDDDNVGYVPRRSRTELNSSYDARGFNSF